MPEPDIRTINPATGDILEEFSFQSGAEVEAVLAQADQAFRSWRDVPVEERATKLKALAAVLRPNSVELARGITVEMGKIISESEAEIEKCAREAEWYAEHGPAMLANEQAPVEEAESYVSFLPLGPILAVMPWNFPFWQVMRFAVPACLAGNVVLLKHSPNVQRSALEIQRMMTAAGFPPGLLQNLLIPNEQVSRVVEDRRIAGATLTGSVRAGAAVSAQAGKALKKSVLELGGSDAFIVLDDADLDAAVAAGVRSRYANAGQVCIAAKRFILTEKIADDFQDKFVEAVRQLRVGDPLDRETQTGPIAREDLREALDQQVQRTLQAGATLLTGGAKQDGPGFFYEPTVLADVHEGMAAADEETFGPVAALFRVPDAAAAIRLANQSEYGLSSSLWTHDLPRARELARQIEAGSAFVNSISASDPRVPIGGIKQSGFGRELSYFGVREFVNIQTVWIGSTENYKSCS